MNSRRISYVVFGLLIAWLVYRGFTKGWTVSTILPLAVIIIIFAASFLEVSHMGLFGKSEYEKQLEVSAKQQAETERQLQTASRQLEEGERRQREHDAVMARSREQQDRYAKLLDTWEAQAQRFEAILAKWEQR